MKLPWFGAAPEAEVLDETREYPCVYLCEADEAWLVAYFTTSHPSWVVVSKGNEALLKSKPKSRMPRTWRYA